METTPSITTAAPTFPCTFDLNVAKKYFYAPNDGEVPPLFSFSAQNREVFERLSAYRLAPGITSRKETIEPRVPEMEEVLP